MTDATQRGSLVRFERMDAIAVITLSRPDAGNGMNEDLLAQLSAAIRRCEAEPMVRAVVLTGEGRFFCVGGDLSHLPDPLATAMSIRSMTLHLHAVVTSLARMRAPSMAAVNGTAAGAGLSLALACDFIVAADGAQFASAYAAAGLSPDGGQSWTLPRRIGVQRARSMMLRGRKLSAQEALSWGLADEVVPAAQVVSAALTLAREFAAGPTAAFGRMKNLLADSADAGLEAQLEAEARQIAASVSTADASEGIAAFLEKRQPQFRGQ